MTPQWNDFLFDLIENFGVLSLSALIIFIVIVRLRLIDKVVWTRAAIGVTFGLVAAIVISHPVKLPIGAVFDTRAGPLLLAGYFGGPVGGLAAAILAGIARFAIGGPAVIGGVISCAIYPVIGYLGFRLLTREPRRELGPLRASLLAVGATVAVLPAFFVGQSVEMGVAVLRTAWPLLLAGNVVSTVILAVLFREVLRIGQEKADYEAQLRGARLAQETAGIGIWRYEPAEDRLFWDEQLYKVYDIDPESFTGHLSVWENRLDPADRDRAIAHFAAAIDGSDSYADEFLIRDRQGNRRTIGGRARIIRRDDGTAVSVLGVNWDVTEERRLQQELALKGYALDNAFSGVALVAAAPPRTVVYMNAAFEAITGYRYKDLIGAPFHFSTELPQDGPIGEALSECLKANERYHAELEVEARNGRPFWMRLSISPLRNDKGELSHFTCVIEDITARISDRTGLQRSRDRLDAILNHAPDAIITVDAKRRIASFNAAAERLFGWKADEIIGETIERLVPEETIDAHRDLADAYLEDTGHPSGPMNRSRMVRARHRDGRSFLVTVTLAHFGEPDEPMVAAIAHDLTEVVEANQRLTEVSLKLEEQLAAAQEANASKSRFLAHMSHELRTPLNAIIGFSDVMRAETWGPIGNARYREYLDDIHKSGSHLLLLINDILDLSKIENNAFPINLEPVPAAEIVRRAVDGIRPLLIEKSLQLHLARGPADALVNVDRRAVHQCLLNLLSNAVKFTRPGGDIGIAVRRRGRQVVFEVSDTGKGIPQEKLETVFQPFMTGESIDIAQHQGTGLGLAITKNLTERMDGLLEIQSEPGRGTIITLGFNAAPPA